MSEQQAPLAQHFFEVGFASCFAEFGLYDNFSLDDARIERCWRISEEVSDDFAAKRALADAAPDLLSNLQFAVKLLEALPGFRGTAQVDRMKAASPSPTTSPMRKRRRWGMAYKTEQYRVWFPDWGEDEDDCRLVMAFDHEEAAKDTVEKKWNEEPFDGPILAKVRCTFGGDDGELKTFSIHPEPTMYFWAYEQ